MKIKIYLFLLLILSLSTTTYIFLQEKKATPFTLDVIYDFDTGVPKQFVISGTTEKTPV